ncbi:Mannose-6-phosphate isomerase 1 [Babesia sp. Xinjiang]|uniref:Mannose-6-phosphate isomerase 1 n=1 Tax=Babesia sp. Xinjiang TaxID=462227 RepID=UPI000A231B36|nr:Mannose-6-phosphate isomerase 1 [Babesia sp. Xinjiang]ORM40071.1 Mannose-6-phosphate isomerase 1 [Babesia sp. Xinjiang]
MDETLECLYRITPIVRNYDWGVQGPSSLVCRLYLHGENTSSLPNLKDIESTPYAELWIGDHDSAPCKLSSLRKNHAESIIDHSCKEATDGCTKDNDAVDAKECYKERLGTVYSRMQKVFLDNGPVGCKILFKVLAIAKPLSLQVHPDPENALRLFKAKHPGIADGQAKPEMSVALSPFRAMCGLRPITEILSYAAKYPPFAKMISEDLLSDMRHIDEESIGPIYFRLCKTILTAQSDSDLVDHLVEAVKLTTDHDLSEEVFLLLNKHYGTDVSITFAFILNCIGVQPGDAFFIPPNTLHSYISGNCVELMNNSDNVIRCGLTSKATDTKTFLELIGVEMCKGSRFPQSIMYVHPVIISPYVKIYQPSHSTCNFSVWSLIVPAGTQVSHCFDNGHKPFLCLIVDTNPMVEIRHHPTCINGKKIISAETSEPLPFVLGDAFLMHPKLTLDVSNSGASDFVMYLGTEI